MQQYDYDLFVIGAGSGGVRAARVAASLGARVAVAEERYLGGTCVNVGCVPKKLFVYGAHFGEDFEDARGFGWSSGSAAFDWPTLRDNKSREIERLNGVYRNLLEGAGVTILEARATLVGEHDVRVGERTISAANILVCTGSWPFVPALPGSDLGVTSNEAFYLPAFPRRALVVGGGYIAVEFAGIFAGLGSANLALLSRRTVLARLRRGHPPVRARADDRQRHRHAAAGAAAVHRARERYTALPDG